MVVMMMMILGTGVAPSLNGLISPCAKEACTKKIAILLQRGLSGILPWPSPPQRLMDKSNIVVYRPDQVILGVPPST